MMDLLKRSSLCFSRELCLWDGFNQTASPVEGDFRLQLPECFVTVEVNVHDKPRRPRHTCFCG